MITHTLGFPRIGVKRELKRAQEAFWKGKIDREQLLRTAADLRSAHWRLQSAGGIDLVPAGDFSLYDHMLDAVAMVGGVPDRFEWCCEEVDLDTYFSMARGDDRAGAMEMTKWFDTNYHYIVPEFKADQTFRFASNRIIDHVREAKAQGYAPKAVLPGPMTFVHLGKEVEAGFDRWQHLDAVVSVYEEVLAKLAAETDWIQLDEPVLVLDLPEGVRDRFDGVYQRLKSAAGEARLMVATYFDSLGDNQALALGLPVDALHVDAVRGRNAIDTLVEALPSSMMLSLGLVNGRNVWRVNADDALKMIECVTQRIDAQRLMLGTSCSLQHVPMDLGMETQLDWEIKEWMAFAKEKCSELRMLADAVSGSGAAVELAANRAAWKNRHHNKRVMDEHVRQRVAGIDKQMMRRNAAFPERKKAQQEALKLPLLPTTTIGSFPQTREIRHTRRQFKKGELSQTVYQEAMRGFIAEVVEQQIKLELDVLVHGESERNDMVEYFGEQLEGFCFTQNGWVQSYGSRCVKPPVIFGDVSCPEPMTVGWIRYAQSLTDKPMKGMLTGPVTLMCWSFVRDDQPRSETCQQIALAMRDEVLELEKAGVKVIQIDEAALREGLPLRRKDWDVYLRWAIDAFRLTSAGVADETQIHTHMCYSEFNEILDWIAQMDADVLSIEASRSRMELLRAFDSFEYPNDIGPGVYDIHSPRIPGEEEIVSLLRLALEVVPVERLWVNPDCGLKTRAWSESLASLENMVAAAATLREELNEKNV